MERVLVVLLFAWAVFQLYFTTFGVMSAVNLRAFHCMFLLGFTFLLYPTYKKERRMRRFPPVWDVGLILLAAAAFGYLILNYTRIAQNGGRVSSFELLLAVSHWSLYLRQPGGHREIWLYWRWFFWLITGSGNICQGC